MDDKDVTMVDTYISKKFAKIGNSRSRSRSQSGKITPQRKPVSRKTTPRRSNSRKSTPKKRTTKAISKAKTSKSRGTRTPRSARSTPYKIEKVENISKKHAYEMPNEVIEERYSQLSESDKDNIEEDVILDKYELEEDSVSVPSILSNAPITRSRTKEYVVRKHRIDTQKNAPKVKLHFRNTEVVESPLERSPRAIDRFYSPLKEKVMTPMKKLARRVQNRVRTTHFINSEVFTNATIFGLVFLFVLLLAANAITKTPSENFDLVNKNANIPFTYETPDGRFVCQDQILHTKVQKLCAPIGDWGYQDQLYDLEIAFENLVHAYNPCIEKQEHHITIPLRNATLFREIQSKNGYLSERVSYSETLEGIPAHFPGIITPLTYLENEEHRPNDVLDSSRVTLWLNQDFNVTAPKLNHFWCHIEDWVSESEYTGTNYIIAAWAICALTLYSLYHFCKLSKLTFRFQKFRERSSRKVDHPDPK
jgi:hypothetical protein